MTTDTHPTDDRLLDLALRLAPDPEREEALRHLRACDPCAARFREVAACHERAQVRAADALATGGAGRGPRILAWPRRLRARRGTLVPWLAAAAILLVVGFGARLLDSRLRVREKAPAMAWMPMPEPTVFLRGGASLSPRTAEGLEAYAVRDLSRARRLLSSSREEGPGEAVRLIYLGSVELAAGRDARALECFGAVDFSQVPEPWSSESRWSIAVAHRDLGHAATADSLLHLLAERPDDLGARARRLLEATGSAR